MNTSAPNQTRGSRSIRTSTKRTVLPALVLLFGLCRLARNPFHPSLQVNPQARTLQQQQAVVVAEKKNLSKVTVTDVLPDELALHLVDCHSQSSSSSPPEDSTTTTTASDPNQGKQILAHIGKIPNAPPFDIAIHVKAFDKARWMLYQNGRYYEHALENAWTRILQQAPSHSRILDVGGNIGYYSFLSIAFGKSLTVDAFEPNPINVLRACETIRHYRPTTTRLPHEFFDKQTDETTMSSSSHATMNLWKLGISDTKGSLTFQYHPKNPGGGRFVLGGNNGAGDDPKEDNDSTDLLHVTTLDDFARARGFLHVVDDDLRIEILKIDVEQHEAHVLVGARALLQRRVIQNIFVEWNGHRDQRTIHTQALQILLDAGYTLCGWGGTKGPSLGNVPFENQDRSHLIENMDKVMSQMKKPHVNLWWQLDSSCTFGT